MDQNQKLRIALVIICSLRIRQFNLEVRISQQMLPYKQISIFVQKGDESQVKILTCSFLDVWPRLMDQNQKLRIALVIIFSLRIRHFNLEPRISQQMMSYKQISMFVKRGDGSQVKILTFSVFWMLDLV